jgi:2-polyprenyl-3-methyl-5-hydroxy-6-metoxy-1,4-benzoquinol methylase
MIVHQNELGHSLCPISGATGHVVRQRESWELAAAYETFLGKPLPEEMIDKYFRGPISEYYSPDSGLRWYDPCHLGDSDFYETLASLFDWYYQSETWDKLKGLHLIESLDCNSVVEVGCGEGHFLEKLSSAGCTPIGIDLNQEAICTARSKGLEAYSVQESEDFDRRVDCLCAFQTIEHVSDPVAFLRDYVSRFHPGRIILSAPSHNTLLGYTSDPLAWPPHHATQWSEHAFQVLAQQIGFTVSQVFHDGMKYKQLRSVLHREGTRRLPGMPYVPPGLPGRLMFHAHRFLGSTWASRRHSILVVLELDQQRSGTE